MKNIKKLGKKDDNTAKDFVLETQGARMPDAERKPKESAKDAAQAFSKDEKKDKKKAS